MQLKYLNIILHVDKCILFTFALRIIPLILLQDYKHRVFGEPSDICTDCGASPQDVRQDDTQLYLTMDHSNNDWQDDLAQ